MPTLPAPLSAYLGDPAYSRQIQQLLPPGKLHLESDSWLHRVIDAISFEFARVSARGAYLFEESDPRTATETLDDWESMLALPDSAVTTIPTTTAARRQAVTQKLIRQGGQHRQFYIDLAAACGYTVTIDDTYGLRVARAGRMRSGARCYGADWAHVWMMTVQAPTGSALAHSELEAIIRRASPAHTAVLFTYL
jgi:uncharacterized protein YmfQ (DUF2313 family)